MDNSLFQVESNKLVPHKGSILISSPLLRDLHFSRTVVLLVEHGEQGSMGIILNRQYPFTLTLDEFMSDMVDGPKIPVFNGGPINRESIFVLHTIPDLKGSSSIGNGLYLNGDLEYLKRYIKEGNPTEGVMRFFAGYSGWEEEQLMNEIEHNTWIISESDKEDVVSPFYRELWEKSLKKMGGKYAIWSRYPQYPILN